MTIILLTFIAIVLLLAISVAAFRKVDSCLSKLEPLFIFTGALTLAIGVISLIVFIFWASGYYGASVKAELLNKEYNTAYTAEQVFYAEEVIDIIQEVKRNRVDLRVNHKQREE